MLKGRIRWSGDMAQIEVRLPIGTMVLSLAFIVAWTVCAGLGIPCMVFDGKVYSAIVWGAITAALWLAVRHCFRIARPQAVDALEQVVQDITQYAVSTATEPDSEET